MGGLILTGQNEVAGNLNRAVLAIKERSREGLRAALLMLRSAATPLTPIETGNLRGSCYTLVYQDGKELVGEIGYTAYYAAYVHEIDKHYIAPGTQWKFLETAMKERGRDCLAVIAATARVS